MNYECDRLLFSIANLLSVDRAGYTRCYEMLGANSTFLDQFVQTE